MAKLIKSKQEHITISAGILLELFNELEKYCKENSRSRAYVIKKGIELFLKQEEKNNANNG